MIIYTTESIEDILKYDKERYNSNNHEPRPNDYRAIIDLGNTKNWIDLFHTNYKTYEITKEIVWMQQAKQICQQTGKFSKLFFDELDTVEDISFNPSFIRTENVSLKYGQHGAGPYTNLKQIIESIVTTIPGHTPLYDDVKSIKLYILPWLDMEEWREFRIFVYKKHITAISQQNIYAVYPLLQHNINNFVTIIIEHFNNVIKNKINLNSYVYDFVILNDGTPYFIEINSFGKGYASGSALFHWLLDEEKLYNEVGDIYVRTTVL